MNNQLKLVSHWLAIYIAKSNLFFKCIKCKLVNLHLTSPAILKSQRTFGGTQCEGFQRQRALYVAYKCHLMVRVQNHPCFLNCVVRNLHIVIYLNQPEWCLLAGIMCR